MGLEVATYINQLQATNPTSSDIKSQGDDHLRVIKGAIKNTFPNITGAVTVTQTQLNSIAGDGRLVEPGLIVMWPYSVASIPLGWKLCNGTGTLRDGRAVPNMVDRFPVGVGSIPLLGTGGSGSHSHTVTVGSTALTIAQIPAHSHNITYYRSSGANTLALPGMATDADSSFVGTTTSQGSGAGHDHTGSANTVSHLPPYIGVLFIIKD